MHCPAAGDPCGEGDACLPASWGAEECPSRPAARRFPTAKAILVDNNPQAGMQAFMAGKIKVQGDMTKMMAMQQTAPDPAAIALAEQIKAMTA